MMNKLKKSMLALLMLLLTFSMLCFPLLAADTTRVYDKASLFSSSDTDALEKTIADIRTHYPLDVVIVTTDDTEGKSSQVYADDFYDENNFGYNGTYDGILLLINMADREIYISTDGSMKQYFTDSRISTMLDKIYLYLKDGNYYGGADCFLKQVVNYMEQGISSNQYTVEGEFQYSGQHKPFTNKYGGPLSAQNIALSVLISALGAMIIAFIIRAIITHSYKHPRFTVPETRPDDLSVHYTEKEDHFVTSHTTRVRIQSDNNGHGSGMSSSHMSSGGHSHGGGGRGF